jgi:hypothetical protein
MEDGEGRGPFLLYRILGLFFSLHRTFDKLPWTLFIAI